MNFKWIGLFLICFSIFLFAFNPSITGAAIGSPLANSLNFIAAVCFVAGLIIFVYSSQRTDSSAVLEERLEVYDDNKGLKDLDRKERHYFMTDPRSDFGSKGVVSLAEFRRDIEEGDEEYRQVVREDYESQLKQLTSSGGSKGSIAKAFLEVLDPSAEDLNHPSYEALGREERREIHLAFRDWKGSLSKIDKDVRQKYGIVAEMGGKHVTLYQKRNPKNKVSTSSTPSVPMGDVLATKIIRMIEKNMNGSEAA